MMRAYALIPLMLLAACSENAGADQNAKATADAANLKLAAGQWETTTEITKATGQDIGAPVLKAGTTTTKSCVGETEGKKPPAALLAGMEDCTYDNIYMSRGRITAGMSCTKPGLEGRLLVSSEGTYAADSFTTNSDIQTYLSTVGDAKASAKITGKRVGDCAAPATT